MNFFKRISVFWLIIVPLLIPGALVSVWRCVIRNLAEQRNIYVETVVDFAEIRQLSREEGWTLERLFAALKKNGASSVAISEDTLSSLESEGKITVLNSNEIRKLSLEETFDVEPPAGTNTLGSLWVHSEDTALLDRIEQTLAWKIPADRLIRIHRNLLLINKSSMGFRERVGLGFSTEYAKMADEAGLGLVVRVLNYPGLTADVAAKIINAIPAPASVSALLFAEEEMLGARGELNKIVQLFKDRSYRMGWVEFNLQDGIESYLKGLAASRPFVRVHSIGRKELDLVYNVNRAVARWVRAVSDRSLKMLYIRCFFQDDKRFIENLATFNLDYLNRTVKELNAAGFKIAGNSVERLNEPRHLVGQLSQIEVLAIGLALFLGVLILLRVSFWNTMNENWCFVFIAGFVLFFIFMSKESFIAFAGLAGAVSYSCIGVILAMSGLNSAKQQSFFRSAPGFVLKMVLPSVFGGLLIAGLYSEIEFLLKFDQFRGIKLAFMLPLIFTGLWSLKNYGRGVFGLLHKPINPLGALVLSLAAAATVLYLLRSGNVTFLKPSELEDTFRTFLENTLWARPRNKEFLVGYPAGLLFIFFFMRQKLVILPLLAIFMQMGQVSVVNSMCHFHTPLTMSLLRIFNGLWLGVLVGLMAVLVVALARLLMIIGAEKEKKIFLAGYFGYGNVGDELLWQTFTQRFLGNFADYQVVVLHSGVDMGDESGRIRPVSRRNPLVLFEELFSCEAFVVPGGGVFQSTTSCWSQFYYLTLLSLARTSGARILLPAQGLGPWGKPGFFTSLANRWLAAELTNAEYLSVRDKETSEICSALTLQEAPHVATDLVFLNENIHRVSTSSKKETLRLYAILRSSEPESKRIAAELVRMHDELENLELFPVAFQPGEDEAVWRDAGWQDDIVCSTNHEAIFAKADTVLSMRLHGCVIAASAGIPWIGIAYDPKVSAFAASCRWQFCCSPEEATRRYFEEKLNLLAKKRVEYADKLNRIANEKRRVAEEDFARLSACLRKD